MPDPQADPQTTAKRQRQAEASDRSSALPAQSIGLIGLGTMGHGLALNIASRGHRLHVYNRTQSKVDAITTENLNITGYPSLESLIHGMRAPRIIFLMLPAGPVIDSFIKQLRPLLSPEDILIDGGNSDWTDTERRIAEHAPGYLLGCGVSGGARGAREGPALMVGGSAEAYAQAAWLLTEISAQSVALKADGQAEKTPCCVFVGLHGAGHFVKAVHNGIEYCEMLFLQEFLAIFSYLTAGTADSPHHLLAAALSEWNGTPVESFLSRLAAAVLIKEAPPSLLSDIATNRLNPSKSLKEPQSCEPKNEMPCKEDVGSTAPSQLLITLISDAAQQSGTGKMCMQASLAVGFPIPTIAAAVYQRMASAAKDLRLCLSESLSEARRGWPEDGEATAGEKPEGSAETQLLQLLLAELSSVWISARLIAFAQGLGLILTQSKANKWRADAVEILKGWRGGCILQGPLIDTVADHLHKHSAEASRDPHALLQALFLHPAFFKGLPLIQRLRGLPVSIPGLASATDWAIGLCQANGTGELLQALRDGFGSHTVEVNGEKKHFEWQ